jgi:hypothetical protein
LSFPWALPTAIELHAFSVHGWLAFFTERLRGPKNRHEFISALRASASAPRAGSENHGAPYRRFFAFDFVALPLESAFVFFAGCDFSSTFAGVFVA